MSWQLMNHVSAKLSNYVLKPTNISEDQPWQQQQKEKKALCQLLQAYGFLKNAK